MKKLLTAMAAFVFAITAQAATIVITEGVFETNQNWTSDNIYILDGFVAVGPGVTLTIEPGTIIMGRKATKGTLVVMRGGQLIADGTDCQPIVFTSEQPVGTRTYGDWGGVIILGNAPVNVAGGVNTIEGGVPNTLIGKTSGNPVTNVNQYGGSNASDNSGILRHVRIEYPGIAFTLDNEINGLTMGGVGSGTTLEYIQVSFCGDDAYEWFGGTVNAKYLIAYRALDDDWDCDLGYNGNVQFAVSLRDPAIADISSSNGWETDNDGTGSLNTPRTAPTFANVTHIGPIQNPGDVINSLYQRGGHLRRSSRTSIYNSIVTGYPVGIRVDGSTTSADYEANAFAIRNNIFAGMTTAYQCTACAGSIDTKMASDGNLNLGASGISLIGLTDPFNFSAPNFQPLAGSLPLTVAAFSGLPAFFTPTSYIGAFDGVNDWTRTWAEWNPNSVDYFALGSVDYDPTVSGTASNATGCNNGSIDITPAGGRGAYSYSWSNGATTQDVGGLVPGSYNVTVSSNGCTASESFSVGSSLVAPGGQSNTTLASAVRLNWTPTSGAVACQVQGQRLPTGPSPTRNVTSAPFNSTNVPFSVAGAGTTWTWRVRCACSTSPSIVATPFSAFGDTFSIPAAREGQMLDVQTVLFPNPASDMTVLSYQAEQDGMAIFRVVDLLGRTVITRQADVLAGTNNIDFNVTDLSAGTYMVEVQQGDKSESYSLIVQ